MNVDIRPELPDGWRWARLREVCRVVSGSTPNTGIAEYWNGEITWITPTDLGSLRGNRIITSARRITKAGYHACGTEIIPPGAVVLSSRAPIGHLAISDIPFCTNQGCKSFVPGQDVDSVFLYYALMRAVPDLQELGSGATFTEISKTQLEGFQIPLPALGEQKRIAEVLSKQMATLQRARVAAEAHLEAAKALSAACLRSVFNSPEAGQWPRKQLGEICHDISDGTHFTPIYVPAGVPFLSVKDIKATGISFNGCRYITQEQHQEFCRRCAPAKGDVLYTKVGTTGVAKAIDTDREFSNFVSVALLKLGPNVSPDYLEKALNSGVCRAQAANLTQGMANRNLVLQDLKRIEVPIPPPSNQRWITVILNKQMSEVDRLRESLDAQLEGINKLPAALLRRAFRGELG